MPTRVIENALDFIVRAAQDFWDDTLTPEQQLKYSTIELFEGIELLLKARLMQVHNGFVLKNIDSYNKNNFESGDFISVNFDTACSRIRSFCGIELEQAEYTAFDNLRKLRNRYVHFHCDESKEAVLSIQVQAWHHILHRLENRFLGQLTAIHSQALDTARSSMLRSEQFLQVRYKESLPTIEQAKQKGLMILECTICNMQSCIVGDGEPSCPVCKSHPDIVSLADDYERLNNPWWKHPREGPDDDVAWCIWCDQQAVVHAAGALIDFANNKLGPMEREPGEEWEFYICLSCGEPALGYWRRSCSRCGAHYFDKSSENTCPACGNAR